VIPQKSVGTGYGIAYMMQNICLCISPYLMGYLVPDEKEVGITKYSKFSLVMVVLTIIGTIFALMIYAYDKFHDGILLAKDPIA
jgi:hypothetical protein